MMERIKEYYYSPNRFLPSLNFANGSQRQQRSERREACIALFNAILLHTELTSMRCGIPTENGFTPLTINVLARRAGISFSRAERAIRDLKRAGMIAVAQITQIDDLGHYKGVPAIKRVNDVLFKIFGLGDMLKRARKAAYKRLRAFLNETKKPIPVSHILKIKLFNPEPDKHARQRSTPKINAPPNKTELFRRLSYQHPELTPEEVIQLIKAHF